MLEKITYENSLGESLAFGEGGLFASANDLRDYGWEYNTVGDRVSSFRRTMVEKNVTLTFAGNSKEECRRMRDMAHTLFEQDIIQVTPGKIWIGEYYLECYVIGTSNESYLDNGRYLETKVKILAESQEWKQDRDVPDLNRVIPGNNGYEPDHDFDIDYSLDYTVGKAVVDSVEAEFTLVIHGYAKNPCVVIAEHAYRLNMVIPAGCHAVIDSEHKTIKMYRRYDDEISNCLYARDPDSYIFERIPYGENNVYKPQGVNIELTIHELRSEPKWI